MRARRMTLIIAVLVAGAGSAAANPFIEADPNIQRGAALQLAAEFGDIRGTITSDEMVIRETIDVVDQVTTQGINRAMTPGEWLKAKTRERKSIIEQVAAAPVVEALPVRTQQAPSVPLEDAHRPVRVIYTANAPLTERPFGDTVWKKPTP